MDILDILKLSIRWVFDRRLRLRLIGYRPVVVCFVKSTNSEKLLLVRPHAHPTIWCPPQEGIKHNEDIHDSVERCLMVELGIPENKIQIRKSEWCGKIIFDSKRQGERDLHLSLRGITGGPSMIGKAYFAALVKVDHSVEIVANPAETSAWKWVDIEDFYKFIQHSSRMKQEILIKGKELLSL